MNVLYYLLFNHIVSIVNKNVDKKFTFKNKEIPLKKVLMVLQILEMAIAFRHMKMSGKLVSLFRFMKTRK